MIPTLEHVLKTANSVNSHFGDTVDQSEQSIVTVDQSELSIESVKCEFTKFAVFSTCSIGDSIFTALKVRLYIL